MISSNIVTFLAKEDVDSTSSKAKAILRMSFLRYCSLTACMVPASHGWSLAVVLGGKNTNFVFSFHMWVCYTVVNNQNDLPIGTSHLIIDNVKPFAKQL